MLVRISINCATRSVMKKRKRRDREMKEERKIYKRGEREVNEEREK